MTTEGAQQACSLSVESLRRGLWRLFRATIVLAMATLPAAAQEQQAARTYQFNIPAKPPPQAMVDLSAVTGVQVLHPEERAFGQKSQAVLGSYTVEQALGLMLQGSGLTYRFVRPDAAIFYDAGWFRAALNLKNLFDEDYFEGAQFRESILPGAPFSVLGSIEVKF